jgi:membrane-bound serine protease (ClpP class)
MSSHIRPAGYALIAALAALAGLGRPTVRAQEPAAEPGIFITVQNPITSEETNRVREKVERAVRERRVTKIVFDFNPDGKEVASRDFGPCADLAKYLKQLHQITTVAFVRNKVTRHTVLPVLACKELVMAPDAVIGDVRPDQAGPPDEDEVLIYGRLAGHGREALVLKMLDKDVILRQGRRNNAIWFFDGRKAEDAKRDNIVAIDPQPVKPAGAVGLYTAEEAQRYGLCKLVKGTRQEVAEAYQLPPASLREDPLEGRSPEVWKIDVRGPVTKALDETLRRRIDRATRRGANMIVLQFEVSGGDYAVARDLADYFRNLRGPDSRPVMTIAFVPFEAPDTATFLALGCSEIVMGQDATFGNFNALFNPAPAPPPRPGRRPPPPPPAPPVNSDAVRDSLKQLAQEQGYSPVLMQGLFDLNLEVYRVRNKKGTVERRFVTKEDLELDQQGERRWENEGLIKAAGQPLNLTAGKAKDFGVARYVVDNPRDPKELYALYGIDPSRVRQAGPDWLDALASFLGDPAVAIILVIVGISCLILELKMPGVGIPGVISALCFVLFFWSQSQMNGQIALLAVLLFLLGLVLIAIEVFLIPGFGVIGVSGIALVLVGLGLATVDRLPQTSEEWASFGGTLTSFGFGLVVATAAAFLLARYLPSIPYANRLVLTPPAERAEAEAEADAAVSSGGEMAALLGAVGTAATMLRPAGMARFGDAYVDVVTEGGFVPAGARVQVVEIEGHRVVVKEV